MGHPQIKAAVLLRALFALLLCATTLASVKVGAENKVVAVGVGDSIGTSRLDLGVDYTQSTFPPNGDPQAVARAETVAHQVAQYQNLPIFGWGSANPEPSPGVYDWSDLDRRMAIIRTTGGIPVITLCCAPDWMKGGVAGSTVWANLTKAPLSEHFGDFAELARQIALRYPDVKHYQIWNEFKGFWSGAKSRVDYEAYTELYNRIYDVLKSISPDIEIGGPYAPMATELAPKD